MKEYHKIDGLYARGEDKKLIRGEYRSDTVRYLAPLEWYATEKIDGMNIRVHWDGHEDTFAGRTDKASIPGRLMERLQELFGGYANETIFEQLFGEKEVTLYGEGYGAKIQSGGSYKPDGNDFILFDIQVGDIFLRWEDVKQIGAAFLCDVVPVVFVGPLKYIEEFVEGRPKSTIGTAMMEGVVAKPCMEMLDRTGKRIIVKVKVRDFEELEKEEKKNA